MSQKYYAVARGRETGIFRSWDECKKQTDGFSKPIFKKFTTESEAISFLKQKSEQSIGKNNIPSSYSALPNKFRDTDVIFTENRSRRDRLFIGSKLSSFDDRSLSRANGKKGSKTHTFKRPRDISDDQDADSKCDKRMKKTDFVSINHNARGDPIVYTDGACVNNGKRNPKAGIGVFWANDHPDNVSSRLMGKPTNNRAEIEAAIVALETAAKNNFRTLDIHTDSQFMIDSMTKWIPKWKTNGWKLSTNDPVKNKDDWIRLDNLIKKMDRVTWTKVKGHSGNYGNERADFLATSAIKR